MSAAPRCLLCDGAALEPTQRSLRYPSGTVRRFPLACGFCGLLVEHDATPRRARYRLGQALAADRFESDETAPFGLDLYTLRTAATRWRRGVVPPTREQAEALAAPHSAIAAQARLFDLAAPGADLPACPDISLGVMCRPQDVHRLAGRLRPHLSWASEIVLLLDAPQTGDGEGSTERVRIARRPLSGDFSRQRNALQDLCRSLWVLQLDADESVSPAIGRGLGALAAMAERDGAVSIGLPRRNHVDGVLAALRPDTQYRLNRREIRYAGVVHERPERDWRRSFIALGGAIDHWITKAHAVERSERYETLAPGEGRSEEVEALLTPYLDAKRSIARS